MRCFVTSVLVFLFTVLPVSLVAGRRYLVEINGVRYTEDDFIHWWNNWKEKDTPFPKTPDPFINWMLLYQEGMRMGLSDSPSYKRKVEVFLKVRSLMLLKRDEVDRKIEVDEKAVKDIYRKDYTPLLHVRAVSFKTEDEAKDFILRFRKSGKSFEKFVLDRFSKKNRRAFDWGWRRPLVFPDQVRKSLLSCKVGDVIGPVSWMGKFWVLKLVARKKPDKKDFERVSKGIRHRLRKKEEGRLTAELIERLKKKYHVWVNNDLLKTLNIKNPKKGDLDKVILRMGDISLTVSGFLDMVKKEMNFRKKYGFSTRDAEKIKESVMANIISQTLTTWEALSRHYERKPPFKWLYEFYCQHRIMKELESQVIWPKIKVTEEEAKRYYLNHPSEFKLPDLVKIAFVETKDKKVADRFHRRLDMGEEFFSVAKDMMFHGALVRKVPVDHLSQGMRKVVDSLAVGEVSGVFNDEGYFCIVKLLEREVGRSVPFEKAKGRIMDKLREERFKKAKNDFIKKLRERSRIKIDWDVWDGLRKKLGVKDVKA